MQPGLELLEGLAEEDVQWLLSHGKEQQVIANTVLFQEGRVADALVFILEGLADVRVESIPNQRLAYLGPGELLGEISFLEGQPASATVTAAENSLLLRIPFDQIRQELDQNPEFAARLYRSFALTSMRRLKERVGQLGQRAILSERSEGEGGKAWQRLGQMIEGFKLLLQESDKAALKNDSVVPPEFESRIREAFPSFIRDLNEVIGDQCGLPDPIREELGARVQRELLPYLLLTRITERLYAKPRGYAGDFMSIDWIYNNEPGGTGRLGVLLDSCFLVEPASQAVRNRRVLLADQIQQKLREHPERTIKITTLACGPAREVFDAFETIDDKNRIEATLIDIDQQAIELVQAEAAKRGLTDHIRLVHGNLVYLSLGKVKIDLAEQDLVYSIGLIDYFSDKFVNRLMGFGHSILRAGGRLILGNFHPNNVDKALMDYVVDWRLIHRTEQDMNRLYEGSAFGRPCTEILFEDAGVNLFAACDRE